MAILIETNYAILMQVLLMMEDTAVINTSFFSPV